MSSKKLPVSINVFATLDYIELVQLDSQTGQLEKAVSLPCAFDVLTRQVADREVFLQTIRDLYNMCRIPLTTPAVLVLPGYFTREIDLPAEFSKDELSFALISEAERFYLFKKNEPQIDWVNMGEGRLLYAAFGKAETSKYQKVFQELKIPLLAIDLSYFAILRGLVVIGTVQEELDTNARWCMLVISDSSFFVSIQDGAKISRTTDAPLSMGGAEAASIVQEIQQDFEIFIQDEQLSKLIIINNSSYSGLDELLQAQNLCQNTIFIEQNEKTLGSRKEAADGDYPCSLEGLGGIFYKSLPEIPRLNFLPESGGDLLTVMHYRNEAMKWLAIGNAAIFLLCLLIWGGFWLIMVTKDHERDEIAMRTSKLTSSLDITHLNEIKRKNFTKSVVDDNVMLNNFLVTLGKVIKNDTWLDKIEIAATGFSQPIQVKVEGRTVSSLDEVNKLPTLLNGIIKNTTLEVSGAAQANTPDGQSYFTWTIQNQGAAPTASTGTPP
jgi:hypothetical protein